MPDDVALVDKVAFLGAAESHTVERPGRVDAIETPVSWVFLTERFAYKLKNPVGRPLNDLRSLPARRRNCLAEVRLNRRLAPEVYLGTSGSTRGSCPNQSRPPRAAGWYEDEIGLCARSRPDRLRTGRHADRKARRAP